MLIVGDGPEWIGRHVRRRLLGDGSGGPCYRIHVSTAASGSFPPADPAAGAGERTTIGYVTARRTATRSAARSARDGRADRVCTTLPELGIAVSSAIEGFEERAASNRVGSVSVSTP